MKVYRVTRRINRSIYGRWKPGGTQTKTVTKRSLSGMLKNHGNHYTYTIEKIEEAEVGPFTDVTEAYLND